MIVQTCLAMFLTAAASSLVTVDGSTRCPAPSEVAARVRTLLPGAGQGAAGRSPDVALLEEAGGRLRVSLKRADGTLIGQRHLERSHSCADLAAAAAVVIATWESDVHPDFRLALPEEGPGGPGRPPSRSPSADILGGRAPSSVQPPPLATTSPPARTPPLRAARPPAATLSSGPARREVGPTTGRPSPGGIGRFDAGLAVLGGLAPGGVAENAGAAAGGLVTAGWTAGANGWGAELDLLASTERAATLMSGTVKWRRTILALGPRHSWRLSQALAFDLRAQALAALLSVKGDGFSSNGADSSVDSGLHVSARLVLTGSTPRRVSPWVELGLTGWSRSHLVYERPSDASLQLPRFEGFLAFGLSFFTPL